MKYLKYFKTDVDCQNYFKSDDFVTPNVSYVEGTNIAYYSPGDEIIMTSESNPEVMKVCYNQGWAASPSEMYDSEAAKVTSIGTAFQGLGRILDKNGYESPSSSFTFSFDEFKYFNGVTSIDDNAFSASNIVSITIPNSVTSIGGSAFRKCLKLTSITIPNSVTSIEESAFSDCFKLTSITIPNSVTSIGRYAFSNSSLNEINCLATTAPSINNLTFYRMKSGGKLKHPSGSDYSSWMGTGDYYLGKYNWTAKGI